MSGRAVLGIVVLIAAIILIPVVVANVFEGFFEGLGVMWAKFNDGQVIRL